jgi:hypothetical protein
MLAPQLPTVLFTNHKSSKNRAVASPVAAIPALLEQKPALWSKQMSTTAIRLSLLSSVFFSMFLVEGPARRGLVVSFVYDNSGGVG